MLRPPTLAVLLLALLSAASAVAEPADWLRWRGLHGNGQSRETDWDPASFATPRVLWKVDVGVGTSNVVCLDAAAGKQLWRRPFAAKGVPS